MDTNQNSISPYQYVLYIIHSTEQKVLYKLEDKSHCLYGWYKLLSLFQFLYKRKVIQTFTVLSSPPDTTQRPSGVNQMAMTPRVWPLYVWIHPFFLMSHILRFVSKEPDTKNSPNGWKSTDIQFDRWPLSVRTSIRKFSKIKFTQHIYQHTWHGLN